ncbi:MAG: hypothetical protein AAB795_01850, partial [Patescibacteria group bacterium]
FVHMLSFYRCSASKVNFVCGVKMARTEKEKRNTARNTAAEYDKQVKQALMKTLETQTVRHAEFTGNMLKLTFESGSVLLVEVYSGPGINYEWENSATVKLNNVEILKQ